MELFKKQSVDVLKDILCDHCGSSCKVPYEKCENFEYMELKASWGYGSKKDFEMWTAHLCEKCVDKLFNNPNNKKSIKINFEVQDLMVGNVITPRKKK